MKKSQTVNQVSFFVPIVLVSWLLFSYCFFPSYYLDYVIDPQKRELQTVELLTFFCSFYAAYLLIKLFIIHFNFKKAIYNQKGLFLIGIIGLASLFFCLEEISWGQSFFDWRTPAKVKEFSVEINLHNTEIPIQSLGNWFIIIVFFIFPILWKKSDKFRLHKSLIPAIPETGVSFCILMGFVWKTVKSLYLLVFPKEILPSIPVYVEFLDQFNEHKEMLVAFGFFLYAWFRSDAIINYFKNDNERNSELAG